MIDFVNVTKNYGKNIYALKETNLHIDRGKFIYLIGKSGAGKTSIFKLLTREIEPTKGKILFDGYDISNIRKSKVSVIKYRNIIVYHHYLRGTFVLFVAKACPCPFLSTKSRE